MPLFGLSKSGVDKMEAKRDINGLIKVFKGRDAILTKLAVEALVKIGGEHTVDKLIVALKDQNLHVRRGAAQALEGIGDARALDGLVVALKDQDSDVRWNSAIALGQISDARAVDGLIVALKDQDSGVRSGAAIALGKIGDARAVDGLVVALKDQNLYVRSRALDALEKIGGEHTVDKLVVALGQYSEAIKCCDEALKINPNNKLALTIKERMMMEHPSIQSRYQHSKVWGMPVLDLRSGKEQAIAYRARSTLESEDEEIAQKLAQLSKLSETQYSRDKAAYEETVAEFRSIGELLCANGGDERMKLIAYRVQALGGRLRNCEMYWDGICGWMH